MKGVGGNKPGCRQIRRAEGILEGRHSTESMIADRTDSQSTVRRNSTAEAGPRTCWTYLGYTGDLAAILGLQAQQDLDHGQSRNRRTGKQDIRSKEDRRSTLVSR